MFLTILSKVISAIAQIGVHPNDSTEVRLQKAIQNNVLVLGAIPTELLMFGFMLAYQEYAAATVTLFFSLCSIAGLIALGLLRRYYEFFKFVQLASAILLPLVVTLMMGGIVNLGFAIAWGMVAPMLAFILYQPRQALYWLGAFLLAVLISAVAQPALRATNHLPLAAVTWISVNTLVGIASMMCAAFYFFVLQREAAYDLLRHEQEKAENLLLNILPKDIAAILKNESRTIADYFEDASVLFADVVNFTPLSAMMSPVELVAMLNEVFSRFDALVEKYELEKIKTIGDCYMVASGVPRARPDHAQVLIRLALEMQNYVRHQTFNGHQLSFRIGVNSGPVVAGVIGRKKFIYDLWGDAVNTASRMESHGTGGSIQITTATYELIRDDFICEAQGTIKVKGKGEMQVWHVLGQKT